MPGRVCLSCISEINHCYSFKLKCESSNRTLRQLLPNALPEESDQLLPSAAKIPVSTSDSSAQTDAVATVSSEAQTYEVEKADAEQNTSTEEQSKEHATAVIEEDEEQEGQEEEEYDYEFTEEQETEETPSKANAENIILHVEKDNIKFETEMVYNKNTGELVEQPAETNSKQKEYKYRLVSNGTGDTYISREPVSKEKQSKQQDSQSTSKRNQTEEQMDAKKSKLTPAADMDELKTKFHCDRCNAGFALEKSLIIHRRQNSCTHRNFKCNECERVFVSLDHLSEHQATHGAFICQECGLRCESMEQLGRHMVQTHKRNLRNQCNVCQKGKWPK